MEEAKKLKECKEVCVRKLVKAGYTRPMLAFTGVKHGTRRATQARMAIAYVVTKKGLSIGMSVNEIAKVIGCSYNYVTASYYSGQDAMRGYNFPTLRRIIETIQVNK